MILRLTQRPRPTLREVGLVAGGFLAAALFFQAPRFFKPSFIQAKHDTISKAQAENQAEAAKSFLKDHPEDFNAYTQLAIASYYQGPDYYVDAMNALEKARALGATQEELFYYAGVMDEALGLPDYAINELTKYLRHHPGDYETSVRLANLYFRQKRFDEAQVLYDQIIGRWPKDPTVLFNYAIVNKEKGKLDQALSTLQEVQKLAGDLPEGGLYEEGEIWRLKGSEETALTFYQQELAKHADYLPALEALEAALRRKGDNKEARATRKRILEIKQAKPISPNPA